MISPGTTLENAVTGERFTFTQTSATTDGELLAFELGSPARRRRPHPARAPDPDGALRGRRGPDALPARPAPARLAGPGDVVEVAPGVVHSFANAGEDEARVRVEAGPALAMDQRLPTSWPWPRRDT